MKNIICLMIFFLAMTNLQAQRIEHFFVQMPDVLNPILSRNQRMELLEFYKAEMSDSITNRFGTQSRLLFLDAENNHLLIQNTEISTIELKLIPHRNDTIITIIRTVCSAICQSSIDFFNMQWQPRTDVFFDFPVATDWIIKEQVEASSFDMQILKNSLKTSFISLSFMQGTNNIIATNHSLLFLDYSAQQQVSPLLCNEDLIFQLANNRKWERMDK